MKKIRLMIIIPFLLHGSMAVHAIPVDQSGNQIGVESHSQELWIESFHASITMKSLDTLQSTEITNPEVRVDMITTINSAPDKDAWEKTGKKIGIITIEGFGAIEVWNDEGFCYFVSEKGVKEITVEKWKDALKPSSSVEPLPPGKDPGPLSPLPRGKGFEGDLKDLK